MITLIEAFHYRCLRYVRQQLRPFQVLVGPNASGKTSFADVIGFLSRLQTNGLESAIGERTSSFLDLTWGRHSRTIELAVEAQVPSSVQQAEREARSVRYEIQIGSERNSETVEILREELYLLSDPQGSVSEKVEAFNDAEIHDRYFVGCGAPGSTRHSVVHKMDRSEYQLLPEQELLNEKGGTFFANGVFVRRDRSRTLLSALWANGFPVCAWLAEFLANEVVHVRLVDEKLRASSAPGGAERYLPDGSNVPWVVARLQEREPQQFAWWVAHLQTALPDLSGMRVIDRPEDRHRYLMLKYRGGLEVPSWMVSDGTMRFLALTLLAYTSEAPKLCLVEEPENSIHPLNVELLMQALNVARDRQVLVTTHSPTVISSTKVEDILVFARDEQRGTQITSGPQHAGLANWKGQPDLSALYASGVFG